MKNNRLLAISIYIFIYLYIFSPRVTRAAVLFSQAANQDVYAGQSFVLDWYLNSENQSINAVDLNLDFSASTLEVTDIGSGSSLINLWIQTPTFDNSAGKISLTGGIANGIVGEKIPLFRATFRAKQSGTAFINLDPKSLVLLNDGAGTSQPLNFRNENFNVYPENFVPLEITSGTHPDQNKWYQDREVKLHFPQNSGTDYSVSFSSNPEIIPDNQPDEIPQEFIYQNLPDGIYYFKVFPKLTTDTWQEAGVYRVQIDGSAPENFTPVVGEDSGKLFVSFSTLDKMSGISHYKVKVGLFGGTETKDSYYVLPHFAIGKQITVTAYDNAGNQRTEKINYDGGISYVVFFGLIGLIIFIGLFWYFRKDFLKRFRKLKNENTNENTKIDQDR